MDVKVNNACNWSVLCFRAPYGKYALSNTSWIYGCHLPGRLAWIIQELPAFALTLSFWMQAPDPYTLSPRNVLFALFCVHYFNRTLIFPLRIRGGKPTPLLVCLLAFVFCTYNGCVATCWAAHQHLTYTVHDHSYMQGSALLHSSANRSVSDPHFICGVVVFTIGLAINWHSDSILINLRRPGETGYKVPRGGFFEFVSGANFFGEIVEWSGFALAAWSLPALAFAVFTFSNIAPRAAQHHRWYKGKFPDYPKGRRAVIPYLW